MIERATSGLHAHLCGLLQGVLQNEHSAILDIGCGSGAWLERVKSLGFNRLVGVDYIRPEPVVGLDLRKFDINHDGSGGLGKYDVVSCIEVIEHIENIGNLLDLLKQTLKPAGFAIITTPNIESLRARVRALVNGKIPAFDDKSDPTHLCPILQDSMRRMLDRRGIFISEVHQYPVAESKTLKFGRAVNLLSSILRRFLPDDCYGDNTIYVLRHALEKN